MSSSPGRAHPQLAVAAIAIGWLPSDCERMLANFILANRETIIARTRARVVVRSSPAPSDIELTNGIPVFLDQLGDALHHAERSEIVALEQIGRSARRHGHDLLRNGLTIRQVVLDYGDVCQAITEAAVEQGAPISSGEFRTLNLCLDEAIAEAVTEYTRQRERVIAAQGTERLGILAHELRNLLNTAMLTFDSIKSGRVAVTGSTSVVHNRALLGIRDLIDRSLADVRLDAGIERLETISVADFIGEVEIGASIQAQSRGIQFSAPTVDREIGIEGDRQILAAALANLLTNAFKFSKKGGSVTMTTRATESRVFFEIEDECGGLPPGTSEELFRPYEQRGTDRTGVGLGLAICMKAAKANGGQLSVRDIPGKGCVFALDVARVVLPPVPIAGSAPPASGPVA